MGKNRKKEGEKGKEKEVELKNNNKVKNSLLFKQLTIVLKAQGLTIKPVNKLLMVHFYREHSQRLGITSTSQGKCPRTLNSILISKRCINFFSAGWLCLPNKINSS